MPSNEFDKILNEKLSGYKAEFNPADWDKMEAMLPQDSKKPFLLVALLLLLLGIGGLWSGIQENGISNNSTSTKVKPTIEKQLNEIPVAANSENKNSLAENVIAPERKNSEQGEGINSKPESNNEIARASLKNETNPTGTETKNHKASTFSRHEKRDEQKDDDGNNETIASQSGTKSSERNHNYEELPLDNTLSASIESEEVSGLNLLEGGQIPDKQINPASEPSNPEVKMKHPVVEFAMGVGPGINFSFTDAARMTKPGYSIDVNEDVMFLKRIGVSLSQSYVVRNYDGGNYPCPVSGYSGCPTSYSSTVKSFDLGIDAKVNLINKSKWDWYVKAGIANVIKMKEKFEYHYPDYDTIIPPQPILAPQTNFNGNTNEALFDNAMTAGGLNYTEAPDLTISGNKRYHLGWHFATGFDYRISSTIGLQFELNHSFTKPTVDEENKRLHSLGLDGKIYFFFGR